MSTPSLAAASLLQSGSTPIPGTSSTAPTGSTTAESAPTPAATAAANAAASGTLTSAALATPAGAQQAAQGAQQAQAPAPAPAPRQPTEEPFNAPMLDLPAKASTHDVLDGLTGAMADPSVNRSTVQRLYEFHQQVFEMEKAMTQVILDGMRS